MKHHFVVRVSERESEDERGGKGGDEPPELKVITGDYVGGRRRRGGFTRIDSRKEKVERPTIGRAKAQANRWRRPAALKLQVRPYANLSPAF